MLGVYQLLVFNAQPTGTVISRPTTSKKDLPKAEEVRQYHKEFGTWCQVEQLAERTCQTADEAHQYVEVLGTWCLSVISV